ncbi:Spermidine/putrescine import ABC transporter permease protein PotB (TC 3.A.1.11.1) [hydrothermal vent metagenome]|uniref:Spermidine/putrescine import ABC transporter permease protein PotB (TC 3.A.1.11.1) n=1 Tax=hydrothermal vent metagenome TaxID=652676 RepID=A0A3B0TFF9_9ZZZZ
MNNLTRSFGPVLSSVIFLLVTIWVIGMIVGPQAIMVEQSFWNIDKGGAAAETSVRIDKLYNEVDILNFDLSDAQALADSPDKTAKIAEITAKIDTNRVLIDELSAREVKPKKVYSFNNYTMMGASHFFIFLKTIVASIAVTIIAFVVCYPIAFTVAKLATPGKAALIMLFLIIPYSINELLRIFAWLMILNYNGVANFFLGAFGFDPVPFLESGAGVFIAMVYAYILFMVFPIYNTVETLEMAQIEAARDMGAPTWQIHRKIVIPHAKPGIAVGCIMTFMLSAGSYAVPAIMTRGTAEPWFTQLIYNKFFESSNWNTGSAYAFTLVIACIIFIFAMMRMFGVGIRDIAK